MASSVREHVSATPAANRRESGTLHERQSFHVMGRPGVGIICSGSSIPSPLYTCTEKERKRVPSLSLKKKGSMNLSSLRLLYPLHL